MARKLSGPGKTNRSGRGRSGRGRSGRGRSGWQQTVSEGTEKANNGGRSGCAGRGVLSFTGAATRAPNLVLQPYLSGALGLNLKADPHATT
jgi:hypothetical protein